MSGFVEVGPEVDEERQDASAWVEGEVVVLCTCTPICPRWCEGACGCEACRRGSIPLDVICAKERAWPTRLN